VSNILESASEVRLGVTQTRTHTHTHTHKDTHTHLLESASEVGLRVTSHLGHDLRPVDQEEESTGLIGHGARDERLTGTGGAVQKHTLGEKEFRVERRERVSKGEKGKGFEGRGKKRFREEKIVQANNARGW
jgi:hypothetical protein